MAGLVRVESPNPLISLMVNSLPIDLVYGKPPPWLDTGSILSFDEGRLCMNLLARPVTASIV